MTRRELGKLAAAGSAAILRATAQSQAGGALEGFADKVDAAAFDPETRMLFFSNGEGTVNVFHQDSADKYSAVETITTQFGAKTMALDLKSKTLYLSTADYEAAETGSSRRRVKPGTFGVLVVSK